MHLFFPMLVDFKGSTSIPAESWSSTTMIYWFPREETCENRPVISLYAFLVNGWIVAKHSFVRSLSKDECSFVWLSFSWLQIAVLLIEMAFESAWYQILGWQKKFVFYSLEESRQRWTSACCMKENSKFCFSLLLRNNHICWLNFCRKLIRDIIGSIRVIVSWSRFSYGNVTQTIINGTMSLKNHFIILVYL